MAIPTKSLSKTHALWAVAAIASFGIGSQFPPDADQSDAPPANTASPSGEASTAIDATTPRGEAPATSKTDTAASPAPLTDTQIAAIGETFRTSNNPIEKRLAFSKLLAALTAENALLVREQIEHTDPQSAEFREFHYAWGAVAGADAALFGIDTEEDDMMPALSGWANADPAAAMAWFQTLDIENDPRFDPLTKDRELDADGLRSHLMRGLVQGLADSDPDAATAFVLASAENGQSAAYHGMMQMVVEVRMRNESPEDAAAWAASIGDDRLRDQALDRVADHFARRDIESAKTWAAEQGNAAAIGQVSAHLARRNPTTAMAWLSELPAGDGQNQGMHRAMREWTGRDPGAASRHLTDMAASPAKDAAISGFSHRIAWDDPEAAIAWAETIGAENHRHETLVGTALTWARRDREAAAEWLAGSGLPTPVQEGILNPSANQR